MKSFSIACLMAASTLAVHLNQEYVSEYVHPFTIEDDGYEQEEEADEPITEEVAAAVVTEQVVKGFEKLTVANEEAEKEEVEEIIVQGAHKTAEVVLDATYEAEAVIEEELAIAPEKALEDAATVYTARAGKVGQIAKLAEAKVAAVEQVHHAAQVSNDHVEGGLLHDIQEVAHHGGDLNELIHDAHLPFSVEVPHVEPKPVEPAEKLDEIVHRSGESIQTIKEDPDFDGFLAALLDNFDPEKPAAPLAAPERPTAPHDGPARPQNSVFTPDESAFQLARGFSSGSQPFALDYDNLNSVQSGFTKPERAVRPQFAYGPSRPKNDWVAPQRPRHPWRKDLHEEDEYVVEHKVDDYEAEKPETLDYQEVELEHVEVPEIEEEQHFHGSRLGYASRGFNGPQHGHHGPQRGTHGPRGYPGPGPYGRPQHDDHHLVDDKPYAEIEESYEEETYDSPKGYGHGNGHDFGHHNIHDHGHKNVHDLGHHNVHDHGHSNDHDLGHGYGHDLGHGHNLGHRDIHDLGNIHDLGHSSDHDLGHGYGHDLGHGHNLGHRNIHDLGHGHGHGLDLGHGKGYDLGQSKGHDIGYGNSVYGNALNEPSKDQHFQFFHLGDDDHEEESYDGPHGHHGPHRGGYHAGPIHHSRGQKEHGRPDFEHRVREHPQGPHAGRFQGPRPEYREHHEPRYEKRAPHHGHPRFHKNSYE